MYYDDGIEPEYQQLYFEKYIKLDPFLDAQVLARIDDLANVIIGNAGANSLDGRGGVPRGSPRTTAYTRIKPPASKERLIGRIL